MAEKFQDILDYMMSDKEWEVPAEQRATLLKNVVITLLHV